MLLPMRVSISFSRSGKAQFWERESNGIISNNSHAVHKHRFTSMAREQVDLLHSACWIDFDLVNITELSASYLFLGVVSRARPRPAGSGARDYKKNKQISENAVWQVWGLLTLAPTIIYTANHYKG